MTSYLRDAGCNTGSTFLPKNYGREIFPMSLGYRKERGVRLQGGVCDRCSAFEFSGTGRFPLPNTGGVSGGEMRSRERESLSKI